MFLTDLHLVTFQIQEEPIVFFVTRRFKFYSQLDVNDFVHETVFFCSRVHCLAVWMNVGMG